MTGTPTYRGVLATARAESIAEAAGAAVLSSDASGEILLRAEVDALPPIVSKFLSCNAPPLTREEIDGLYSVGVRLYGRERWSEASEVFRLVASSRPEQARGWMALAACHEALGEDACAIALYELACITPAPTRHRRRARFFLARLHAKLGRHREAREELDALELDPSEPDHATEGAVAELRRALVDTLPSS